MCLNESVDTAFFYGREFSSFEELSNEISEFEKRFFVNYKLVDSCANTTCRRLVQFLRRMPCVAPNM